MMLLADIGNTRIKWAESRDNRLGGYGAAVHAGTSLDEVLTAAWSPLERPTRIVAVNVAGNTAATALTHFCTRHFSLAPDFLLSSARCGVVVNGYHDPSQLGADRWAAVIGAFLRYGGPVCVVACGTAITVDAVNREGRHLGGLIAPGIATMRKALAGATAAIPDAAGEVAALFGLNTRTAVACGVTQAAAGLIERTVRRITAELGTGMQVLLTGGDAEYLQSQLTGRYTLAPHLVLEGVLVMAEQRT